MTPEERQLLIQTSRLVEDNNKMLHKMHRAALLGRIMHLFYWLIIIGLSVGTYIYIQPYIDQLKTVYTGFGDDVKAAKGVTGTLGNMSKFLKISN